VRLLQAIAFQILRSGRRYEPNRIPVTLTVVSPFARGIEFRSSSMPGAEQLSDAVGSLEAGAGQHDHGRLGLRDRTVTQ
jgi:hypothetical protein